MPLLSRRVIQRLINENSTFIAREALATQVARLNTGNVQSLDSLWEIIVVNLLSKSGIVNYETNHGGTSRPDIHFKMHGFEIVADITCISDQDSVNKNDIDYFVNEFLAVAKKSGIQSLAGFNFQFEGTREWREKVKLRLPVKPETRKFIEKRLKVFIVDVAQRPDTSHQIAIDDDVVITVAYTPNRTTFSMGYPTFTQARNHQSNVLYNRLAKKRDQLKKSGFSGLKGVFICDADCALFGKNDDTYESYGIRSIINNFLNGQDTISFVFMLHVNEQRSGIFGSEMNRNFEINAFSKETCYSEIVDLTNKLNNSIISFAKPERNAKNAVNVLKANRSIPGANFYRGYRMTGNKIRISLRTILQLISGELNHEKFLHDHEHMGKLLLNRITSGYPLESLAIIREKNSDDDWLEFFFDETLDPALNPYFLNHSQ